MILGAVPPGCQRVLDVGCGKGALTRRLATLVPHVTGIDRDGASIALARAHPGAAGIGYVLGDFLAARFESASFDLVTSVAAVHHMDAEAALRRMSEVLRPGSVLAVVGLARGVSPAGLAYLVPAMIGTRVRLAASARQRERSAGSPYGAYTSPVIWPPPLTWRQTHRLAARVLPSVRYRTHLYWRFSLVWTKPGG